MQMNIGRPKDLVKKKQILDAAKRLFLKQGFHGSSMNQIAKEAGVTKLTVYNHFQDKESLFTYAIAETCEESINARRIQLHPESNFLEDFYQVCSLALQIVNLPEAIKLEHLLLELAAEQNPLAEPFYNASHKRLFVVWTDFFAQAIEHGFIQKDDAEEQTHLLLSLLLGHRHHEVLLGVRQVPSEAECDEIIHQAIELFMLKYKK
ncbi:TetR/AcrR family transcriptional regulator [Acinetobacter sp. YH16032]|uniref:TetR/AcrR family transcriptional regulator n=1 Tax=Acinetobacter sp. YH16032 TaxID=2601181 RepID=UPI0015D24E3C